MENLNMIGVIWGAGIRERKSKGVRNKRTMNKEQATGLRLAEYLSFFDYQFTFFVHAAHGADDGFNAQAGHIGDLLAG